jgi:hypothetical protein
MDVRSKRGHNGENDRMVPGYECCTTPRGNGHGGPLPKCELLDGYPQLTAHPNTLNLFCYLIVLLSDCHAIFIEQLGHKRVYGTTAGTPVQNQSMEVAVMISLCTYR